MRDIAIFAALLPVGLLCLGAMRAIARTLQARGGLTPIKAALILAGGYLAVNVSIILVVFATDPARLPPPLLRVAILVVIASAVIAFPMALILYRWLRKLRAGPWSESVAPPDAEGGPPPQ